MDTDSFIMHIKIEDLYEDIADDIKKRFDTSNYEFTRPLLMGTNKKMIELMKNEFGGKIITEFVGLGPKINDGSSDKKAKGTKKCVIKRKLKFIDYKTTK